MDTVDFKSKMHHLFDKYKYVALIAVVGVMLMLLPTGGTPLDENVAAVETVDMEILENAELADILGNIYGVGEVKVLLSVATGEEIIYQVDEDMSDNSGNMRRTTVVVSNSSKNQQGLIKQVIPPSYLGAVVVCSGGNNPAVRLAVVDAVSNLTGLTTDKISVIKMK